ncbi:MAG: ATP-dependent RNA helicase dbp7 [Cirrosporium novae-zelandiae]|nr:MAG: ATP-dependent RNA helicase dbp7 [Cirrosporium novae-zelandiae]
MADDGFQLNFSFDAAPLVQKTSFKGGRWKDRLIAKRLAQHRQTRKQRSPDADEKKNEATGGEGGERTNGNPNHIKVSGPRPQKRQRQDGEFEPASTGAQTNSHNQQQGYKPGGLSGKPREFISSLFTFNPEPKTALEEQAKQNAEPIKPSNAPLKDELDTFTYLGVSPILAAHLLKKLELKAPTAIQKASLSPLLNEDADAFIQAETGSGKTLAYLLPIVQRIMNLSAIKNADGKDGAVHRDSGLFAIILAPTRELCRQISVVLEKLLRCASWLVAGTVTGGEKKKSEKARLRKGLNILVATPGRLTDHLDNTEVLNVSNVRWLVLDEGDRLMELGFEEQIRDIVEKLEKRRSSQLKAKSMGLPLRRITILCSATMKTHVEKLGEISLKDAVHIKADPTDVKDEEGTQPKEDSFSAPAQLRQSYSIVAAKLRLVTLTAALRRTFARRGSIMKAIVFMSCADSVDFHFQVFSHSTSTDPSSDQPTQPLSATETSAPAPCLSSSDNQITVHKLHGSLPQVTRTSTLHSFSTSTTPSFLICTDVASRGLDLPNIDLVIEYDPAFSAEDHLHRIGRTARAGRDGRAIIFLQPGSEEAYVSILKNSYRDTSAQNVVRTEVDDLLKKGFGSPGIGSGNDWEVKATDYQLEIERWIGSDKKMGEMARKAFMSHIRAYATHISNEREMFNIKNLHLGHWAKSFGLREKPSNINVPGIRQGRDKKVKGARGDNHGHGAGRKRAADPDRGGDDGDRDGDGDDVMKKQDTGALEEAKRKMYSRMWKNMNGASEFNIG